MLEQRLESGVRKEASLVEVGKELEMTDLKSWAGSGTTLWVSMFIVTDPVKQLKLIKLRKS